MTEHLSEEGYQAWARLNAVLHRISDDYRNDVEAILGELCMMENRCKRLTRERDEARIKANVGETELHSLRQRYSAMEGEIAGLKHDLGKLVEECEQARQFERMVGRLDGRLE
jgi:uncharacterized coiled-coil DUF342 family protein